VLLFLIPTLLAAEADPAREPQGLTVEGVETPLAGEAPAVQPGDVLVSWARAASPPANPLEAHGVLQGPFDLADVEMEQSPRGLVTLSLLRHGEALSLALPPTEWRIDVRPPMAPAVAALYGEARLLLDAKEEEKALAKLRETVSQARQRERSVACWLLSRVGDIHTRAKRWDDAVAAYREAVPLADGPLVRGILAESVARALRSKQDLPAAEAAFREALAERAGVSADSLAVASTLHWLARVAWYRNNIEMARDLFRKALALREKSAPESLVLALTQFSLAVVLNQFDVRDEDDLLCRHSLAIRERLAPGSLAVAQSDGCLSNVARRRGDLATARRWQESALRIQERLAPESNETSWMLNGLAILAVGQGDYAEAESLTRKALAMQEKLKLDPQVSGIQVLVANVGRLAANRGDFDTAEAFYRRSLDMCVPESIECSYPLMNLAQVAETRGDTSKAEALAAQAVALLERLPPDSPELASGVALQGGLAVNRHDWERAEELLKRALSIQERRGPQTMEVAGTLGGLAEIAEGRGDREKAEALFARSVSLRERLAPNTAPLAEALHSLGRVRRALGNVGEASALWARAIDVLEAQRGRVGGSDAARALFLSQFHGIYQDQIELLVDHGRIADAFRALERSRARSLLALMAERDLVLTDDVPPELESERRRRDADYERVQSQLAQLSADKDTAGVERLTLRLGELREAQAEIADRIRQSSPRLAELRDPRPLDVEGVRASLDAGSVLLAYAVGKDATVLFVLQAGGTGPGAAVPLEAVTIPIGEAALRARVESWRRLLERTAPPPEFFTEAQALYDLLLRPVEPRLASARRLLISPDGPLHTLPFGALRRRDGYLIEWKPVHFAQSGTLYARLLKDRRSAARPPTLVAFGAPHATTGGLDPLPATRLEIEALARLFPGATTYLGDQASEERAKAIGKRARYVHFACHALIDARFPLDSALALTPAGHSSGEHDADNGLLRAWEIFERVRLDADLVTLSACGSATGTSIAGEGLLGLTRAFQYAGARSVLASLWSVGDQSALELMARFYGLLRRGLPKDDALRQAQLTAIRSRRHPVRWAAFQLYGDWR
jgi:CHAT domain-containing protein